MATWVETFVGARVYNSAQLTIATATAVALTFDSERYDTDTIHDTIALTTRLTCNTAGKYIIVGNVKWDGVAVNDKSRILIIRLNGATEIGQVRNVIDNEHLIQCVTTIYDLSATDYVELVCYQDTGGNVIVSFDPNYSPEFMMSRIG